MHSYELATDKDWEVPRWWLADGDWTQYRVGIDRSLLYQGKPTVFLRSLAPKLRAIYPPGEPIGSARFYQSFSARHYQGKRVRLAASLRSVPDLSKPPKMPMGPLSVGPLSLGALFSNEPLFLAIDNAQEGDAKVSGSGIWKRYEIVEDVPADAELIEFGVWFNGIGTLWVANVSFELVERSVPLTFVFPLLQAQPQNLDFTKTLK